MASQLIAPPSGLAAGKNLLVAAEKSLSQVIVPSLNVSSVSRTWLSTVLPVLITTTSKVAESPASLYAVLRPLAVVMDLIVFSTEMLHVRGRSVVWFAMDSTGTELGEGEAALIVALLVTKPALMSSCGGGRAIHTREGKKLEFIHDISGYRNASREACRSGVRTHVCLQIHECMALWFRSCVKSHTQMYRV